MSLEEEIKSYYDLSQYLNQLADDDTISIDLKELSEYFEMSKVAIIDGIVEKMIEKQMAFAKYKYYIDMLKFIKLHKLFIDEWINCLYVFWNTPNEKMSIFANY